jgi:hypothetical protein
VPSRNDAEALGQEPYQRERIRSYAYVQLELGSVLLSLIGATGQQGVSMLDHEGGTRRESDSGRFLGLLYRKPSTSQKSSEEYLELANAGVKLTQSKLLESLLEEVADRLSTKQSRISAP